MKIQFLAGIYIMQFSIYCKYILMLYNKHKNRKNILGVKRFGLFRRQPPLPPKRLATRLIGLGPLNYSGESDG
jgi:hypothetical protein